MVKATPCKALATRAGGTRALRARPSQRGMLLNSPIPLMVLRVLWRPLECSPRHRFGVAAIDDREVVGAASGVEAPVPRSDKFEIAGDVAVRLEPLRIRHRV